jgi:cytochrome b561
MARKEDYDGFDRFLHWLMAINIGLTLVFARGMSHLPDEERVLEYGDHGLSVTTIAICLLIRIPWRARTGFPAMPAGMGDTARLAAKAVHYGLYLVLVAQICVGVFLASTTELEFVANGYGINYTSFDLAPDDLHDTLLSFHEALYWTIIALLAVHILAALKHHFVDRDEVLLRMLPFTRGRRVRGNAE